MNTILRNFFYSIGIILLWALHYMDPNTTQLRDILLLIHSDRFWMLVQLFTVVLVALQWIMSPSFDFSIYKMRERLSRKTVRKNP